MNSSALYNEVLLTAGGGYVPIGEIHHRFLQSNFAQICPYCLTLNSPHVHKKEDDPFPTFSSIKCTFCNCMDTIKIANSFTDEINFNHPKLKMLT